LLYLFALPFCSTFLLYLFALPFCSTFLLYLFALLFLLFSFSRAFSQQFLLITKMVLPIVRYLHQIFPMILHNVVSALFSPTGSGKSTGVAFALIDDDWLAKMGYTKAYMSIPTVVACNVLHGHVSSQLGEKAHRLGYAAGSVYSSNFRKSELAICTTQVVINQLIELYKKHDDMQNLLVIIDEAHHTSLENRVLMSLCDWLIGEGFGLRVLIMTATPAEWNFRHLVPSDQVNVSSDDVPHFPIREHFLPCDIFSVRDIKECRTEFGKLYDEIIRIIGYINSTSPGNILVFVPGEAEAEELAAQMSYRYQNFDVATIYSSRSKEEIDEAIKCRKDVPKIFIGTNAVETSITLPDLRYVIDTLCHKQMIMRNRNGRMYGNLSLELISQSASMQRRGRTGRVCPGEVFYLCTRSFWLQLNKHSVSSFDTGDKAMAVLNLLGAEMPAFDILNISMADRREISQRMRRLGVITPDDHLTDIGRNVSKFPLPLEMSVFLSRCANDSRTKMEMLQICLLVAIISAKDNGTSPVYFPKGFKGDAKKEVLETLFMDYFYNNDIEGIIHLIIDVILATNWCTRGTGKYMKERSLNDKFFRNVLRIFRQIGHHFIEKPTPDDLKLLLERITSRDGIFDNVAEIASDLFPVYQQTFSGSYVEVGNFSSPQYMYDSLALVLSKPRRMVAFTECSLLVPDRRFPGTMRTLNILSLSLPL
jgi:HrpA-like RNA helicase